MFSQVISKHAVASIASDSEPADGGLEHFDGLFAGAPKLDASDSAIVVGFGFSRNVQRGDDSQ